MLSLASQSNLGPIPFRFCPLWINQKDFMVRVSEIWIRPVTGSPFFVWEEKLRRVKIKLKGWAKNIPSPAEERKKAQVALESHQILMEEADIERESLSIEEFL